VTRADRPRKPGAAPAPARAGRATRRRRLRRIALRVVGWALVPLGLAGLVLPVLQGVLFLVMAAAILSRVDPRVRLGLWRARKRWPRLDRTYRRAESRARLWLARLGLRGP